ncbi:MAG TPA: argininosuccinate lyase [Firmicutes bacterium]|nr:argininosuccinate lyase [Bacillota bacterium]
MTKLWEKDYQLDQQMERFTVGDDYLLDRKLIRADVLGSIAHAKMLSTIEILTAEELAKLKKCLLEILSQAEKGEFQIRPQDEDVHTAVENALTKRLGELGKKIHTGRSRNDQVLVDIRIYTRERLLVVQEKVLALAKTLLNFADQNRDVPMPGRTHTQRAMPSSVGLWAAAFTESLLDDLELLKTAYFLNNQSPLGSAASYGVGLPIDRQLVSDLLGFDRVQNNVLYANNSRGKMEAVVVFALSQVTEDLAKLSGDLILFSIPEFGYFTLPKEYCPGSSIMPQKQNPGPLELVRARSARVLSRLFQLITTIRSLPSGYNRDFQETKGPLMEALETTEASVEVVDRIFQNLGVNRDALSKSFTPELFAADRALRLVVEEGLPFRDAYRKVASELGQLKAEDPRQNILSKRHLGAPGNLGLEKAKARIESETERVRREQERLQQVWERLLGL